MRNLLSSVEVHLVPAANPDGFTLAHLGSCSGARGGEGRANSQGVDIDTDFPQAADRQRFQEDITFDPFLSRQEETVALMNWAAENPFMMGLELSSGATVLTYPPYEQGPGQGREDQRVFKNLAQQLSETIRQ